MRPGKAPAGSGLQPQATHRGSKLSVGAHTCGAESPASHELIVCAEPDGHSVWRLGRQQPSESLAEALALGNVVAQAASTKKLRGVLIQVYRATSTGQLNSLRVGLPVPARHGHPAPPGAFSREGRVVTPTLVATIGIDHPVGRGGVRRCLRSPLRVRGPPLPLRRIAGTQQWRTHANR